MMGRLSRSCFRSLAGVSLCGLLAGCAISNLTRVQPDQDPDDYGAYSVFMFKYPVVAMTLAPVMARQGLTCADYQQDGDKGIRCKTWAGSTSSLTILDHQGDALVYVRESLPTLWIPEPYDSIRKDAVQALQTEFTSVQLECRYGQDWSFDCWQWTFPAPEEAAAPVAPKSGVPFASTYFEGVSATMPGTKAAAATVAPGVATRR